MLHQNAVRHIEDKFFIFDDNNRLPCSMSHGWSRFFDLDERCLDTWQENHHRGPGTHLRTQLHEPPRLTDDPVHGREPETSSLVLGLGAEERLECAIERFPIHAGARVGDSQAHIRPGVDDRMEGCVLVIDGEILSDEGQRTAVGHRVACIHRQVEKDLLHLSPVSAYGLQVARSMCDQRHVFAERPTQQGLDLTHDIVDVENLEMPHLSAGKGEQLMGEAGGSLRCRADLRDVAQHSSQPPARIDGSSLELQADLVGHERNVVQDRSQEIVEVVRNSSGEVTEALEPVGLVQSRLQKVARQLHRCSLLLAPRHRAIARVADRR